MTVWGGYETAVEDEGSCRRADGGGCASHDRLTLFPDASHQTCRWPLLGPTGRKGDVRQRPLSVAHDDNHLFSRANIMQYTSGMPC